jgi:uncharacterized protein (TIGR04255 family)
MPNEQETVRPSKLTKDAIVEAVCELRFDAQPGISGVLPGLLFGELKGLFSAIERMHGLEIPPILLQIDPNMQFLASQRLKGDGMAVIVGDRIVGIVCSPYIGWQAYKALILRVWSVLSKLSYVTKPVRASLKYVNILDDGTDLSALTRVVLQIGKLAVTDQPTQIRTEFADHEYTRIITIANPAEAQLMSGEHLRGCVVDVDVLCMSPSADILENGEELLDNLHSQAKDLFFDILSDAALAARGPTYG